MDASTLTRWLMMLWRGCSVCALTCVLATCAADGTGGGGEGGNGGAPAPDTDPLTWQTPITLDTLGVEPDDRIAGMTLEQIVSNDVVAWDDWTSLCSKCHYEDGYLFYQPDHTPNGTGDITSRELVNGRAWAGNMGWGRRFVNMGIGTEYGKPEYLRAAFTKWLDDGSLTGDEAPELPAPDDVDELTWTSPITVDNLGVEPEAELLGNTIADIVNSRVSSRPDGMVCSTCHYGSAAGMEYRPPIIADAIGGDIAPGVDVAGRTWDETGGWAERYLELDGVTSASPDSETEKPAYMRALFAKWVNDGAQFGEGLPEPVLEWSASMTAETLGFPDTDLEGTSIDDIINSRVAVYGSAQLCSECHYSGGPFSYRPDVAAGSTDGTIDRNTVIEGETWSGPGGWAETFAALEPGNGGFEKPTNLTSMFAKWLADGEN